MRRELERIDHLTALARLERFANATPERYLRLTDEAIRRASGLWAQARNRGTPTADPKELDCDVLIASQALELGFPESEFIIATENVGHLSQFCPAAYWRPIDPAST